MGLIFSGQITTAKIDRSPNMTDTFAFIQAQDCDAGYNEATISKTLVKGYTANDQYQAFLFELKKYGISEGSHPKFPDTKSPRGTTLHGMVKDRLRIFSADLNCDWWIETISCISFPRARSWAILTHEGSTRGNDWYTDIVGVALDPSKPRPTVGPTLKAIPDEQ